MQEVYNHDVQFSDGIRKTKIAIDFLKRNYRLLAANLGLPSKEVNNIFGIIISRTGTPSAFIEDPCFPVIEEDDFLELVCKQVDNVEKLYGDISSLVVSKKSIPGAKLTSFETKIGDYLFILPAAFY